MNEKRNPSPGTAPLTTPGTPPPPPLGARQDSPPPPAGGGGYLSTRGCTNSDFELPEDPRLADLRRIGLPRAWLMVAETVGVDAFLEVWRRLSSEDFGGHIRRDTGGTRMPELRSYDSYLRYQRNRYIDALAARGLSAADVRRAVARNLREPLDEKHVFKIMRRG